MTKFQKISERRTLAPWGWGTDIFSLNVIVLVRIQLKNTSTLAFPGTRHIGYMGGRGKEKPN